MVASVTLVNIDTMQEVARELTNELKAASNTGGPIYRPFSELTTDASGADIAVLTVAFLFRRKDGGAYAANEACRILTRRCKDLARKIDRDRIQSIVVVDCATKSDILVSDFSILGEYLSIIAEEISPNADADVLCLDYECDTTVTHNDAITIRSIVSIHEEKFIEKALEFCVKNTDFSREDTVFG